ncbi:ABC transporter ATP-binding protein [Fusibacter sp. JL216-2]|uniref:ABC transporter ATP-binding protein n=1 Tax=Fusibacter sp. JL216-2 TaxID=3071453 RepID=UPI003D33091A
MNAEFIKVTSLTKNYKMGEVTVKAIQDITFTIKEGEFVVILGPSGSGKSTLLNIIGGMDVPSEGQVVFDSVDITNYNDKQLTAYRRNDVGFVFQFYNLMANLTAKENVELATEICSQPLEINEIMQAVELSERADHFPAQMSGGEQQRVAIARAVAKNPKILLCDEPTGALDFKTGLTILKLLSKINKEMKKTVMVITHNAAIGQMADRVIKLRSGKITEDHYNEEPISPERIVW